MTHSHVTGLIHMRHDTYICDMIRATQLDHAKGVPVTQQ